MGKVSPLRWLKQAGNKFPKVKRTRVFTKLIYTTDKQQGDNPLHIAARFGYIDVVDELVNGYKGEKQGIDQKPPWNEQNKEGNTPLHLALKSDHIDVALFLLEHFDPVSLHIRNNERDSVLSLAIQKPKQVQLKISKKQNVRLSSNNESNEHAAMVAWLRSCSDDVLREVLKNNLEFLEANDTKECNVLHKWAEDGNVSALAMISKDFPTAKSKVYEDLILKRDLEMRNSPLHIATKCNKIEFVESLVEGSKNIIDMPWSFPWKIKNKDGNTPLHMAIYLKHTDIALYLLKHNSSVWKICNNDGESPFFRAVASGLDKVVNEMLDTLDISFSMLRNNDEMTVLHQLPHVSVDTAKMLLKHLWWIINLRDKQGRTALDVVEEKEDFDDNIKNWLKNPIKIENKKLIDCYKLCEKDELSTILSFSDHDFLHYIQLKNYQDYLNLLKNTPAGELKNCVLETDGTTPLHRALDRNDIGFAKALLSDDKVERDIKDHKGRTATDLLAGLCNSDDDNWASMCKIINVNPHLRTTYIQPGTDMEQMRNTLSVVAALLATITFAAGFTLPGGLHGDSGNAILATKGSFLVFLLADAYAMCTSMLVLFCLIWSMVSNRDMSSLLVDRSVVILMHSLYATMLAFMIGIYATVAHSSFWATIVIFIMCLGSAFFAWKTVYFFTKLFSKELEGKKISKPPEESASTSTNINFRNASERSNKTVQNSCLLFFKYQWLTSRRNQDKTNSACLPKEESAPILSNVGSKKESESRNKLVQIFFGILKVKKLFSKRNRDARDSTRSLEEGESSTSKNDVSHVTDVE